IANPSYLGARGRAQDRAAQSNVRNGLTAEKTYFTDNQKYSALAADLTPIEPSLTYVASNAAGGSKEVMVVVKDVTNPTTIPSAIVCVTGKTAAGKYFQVVD